MRKRPAFTLVEVLIAIALMGLILPALYESVALLRESNTHLFKHLEKTKKISKVTETLYLDLLSSDGNISIVKDDFSRVCIEKSKNALYGLSEAKVCWLVLKNKNTLARVEGYDYTLPLRSEDRVEIDTVMQNITIFDLYYKKEKILVILQQANKKPITFMIQGVAKPQKKKKKVKKKSKKRPSSDQNSTKNPSSVPPVPGKTSPKPAIT